MPKKPELLIPIKNLAGLKACGDYADAVYLFIRKINMVINNTGNTI